MYVIIKCYPHSEWVFIPVPNKFIQKFNFNVFNCVIFKCEKEIYVHKHDD